MAAIIVIIVVAAVIFVIAGRNSLVNAKNKIEAAEQELVKYEEIGDERDIDNARKYLNAVLRDYNNMVEKFPMSLVAELFNFPKMHTEDFDEGL